MARTARETATGIGALARALAAVAVLAAGAMPGAPRAAEIHRCPQPDGTTRFQDRPCAPEAARPPARDATTAPPPVARDATTAPRPPTREVVVAPRPTEPAPPPVAGRDAPAPAENRAEYVARNEARCREGDRRACAAVTCERSGRLDSPACQEAVGYLRGAGWDLRPRTDLFDPARTSDEFTLTCRAGGRRATLTRARGTDVYSWPAAASSAAAARDVPRAGLPAAAQAFCAAP